MIMISRISATTTSMITTSPMDRVNVSSGDDTGAPASSVWNLSPYSFDEFWISENNESACGLSVGNFQKEESP